MAARIANGTMADHPRELTRTLLGVIFLGALIVASFWILRPFLGAAIWATMIVFATVIWAVHEALAQPVRELRHVNV